MQFNSKKSLINFHCQREHVKVAMKTKFVKHYLPHAYFKTLFIKCSILFVFLALSSCNYFQEYSRPKITTLSPPKQNHIKTVAILPFKNLTDNEEIPAILRNAIFSITKNHHCFLAVK